MGGHDEFGDFCKLKSEKSAEFVYKLPQTKTLASSVLVKKNVSKTSIYSFQNGPYFCETRRCRERPVGGGQNDLSGPTVRSQSLHCSC